MSQKEHLKNEIPISEFKAHCLRLLGETGKKGKEYIITKKGVAIAQVLPIKKRQGTSLRGVWKGLAEIHGDIVNFNLADDWEATSE